LVGIHLSSFAASILPAVRPRVTPPERLEQRMQQEDPDFYRACVKLSGNPQFAAAGA